VIATVWLFAKHHLVRLLYALRLQGIGGRSIYQNISSSPKFASDKLSDRGSLNIGYIGSCALVRWLLAPNLCAELSRARPPFNQSTSTPLNSAVSQHHFAAQPSRGFPSNVPKSVTWLETAPRPDNARELSPGFYLLFANDQYARPKERVV